MNTLEYLTVYDKVVEHLLRIFRDDTLPPNAIDVNARLRAQNEALLLHRSKNLISYFERMKAGTV